MGPPDDERPGMAEALKSRVVATEQILRAGTDNRAADTAPSYVDHFRARVLQDALAEATAMYWRRRAETFAAARPRAGDFQGTSTDEQLAARDRRLAATAQACRSRASLVLGADDFELVDQALAEVA
jgi:hypothetical protein